MMVAPRHSLSNAIDTLERARIMQQLSEVLNGISTGADEIAAGKYWESYQTVSRCEYILAEIADKLHELDLKRGGAS